MATEAKDAWSSKEYQHAAGFVPKLATKVLTWLDVQPDDQILDVGCGDGILNLQIAQTLAKGTGKIHGIDSSASMIHSASTLASSDPTISQICTFEVLNATSLSTKPALQNATFDKVFSNAAMHWILRPEAGRKLFFKGVNAALKPSGMFVFEMGGMGNVAEMRAILLCVIARRVGIVRAREVDPWFFPDESWMEMTLEEAGFNVEVIERQYRPTMADVGGVEAWVRLMGKAYLDVVVAEGGGEKERDVCVEEICEVLQSVCQSPGGGEWLGYVRLRAIARKI